ncbi:MULTISPECIES: hypothetical protein [unclassified Moorena]|uniref:DUF2281 domain-containing protein n=1 Tax=Moorena bouillonii PNG TaxID=568701 RepID=A0A1U7MVD4_9CYAN|nr:MULTISPECIES: hypothetical protein [unclassified Moorena]NEO12543.1 hypothetical protein [Moorena sp. SIO3E8]NEO51272.1 hypothetical protein [Moorena sp. SIO4A3]NEQ01337.1 hypothetical protein [Moorena sp. SIO3F7]OLT55642.1 hypothetical protein BJP37_32490 [Moorena bouillonii PNG]
MRDLEQLTKDIQELPEEVQNIIADIIEVFKKQYVTKKPASLHPLELDNQPFIGMWRDRQDTQNSSEWVRRIRQQHWQG